MKTAKPEQARLPELRAELALLEGAADANGQPTWLIHDPMMNRFTQIGQAACEALKHWRNCRTAGELVEQVNASGRAELDMEAVARLVHFLQATQLTIEPRAGGWESFAKARADRRHSWAAWLIHNYLFIRVPLVKPQPMLERTLPYVRRLWSRGALLLYLTLGLIGLYLASRQWDAFVGSLLAYFDWEGAVVGLGALVAIKTAHELGHAYAAAAYGCRVHTMGIAFMVMAPLPYTDVTDAWRLTDRRKRLVIDSAGMITEAAIAAIALFLWAFLPDGALRSTAFVLAAVSIVSSVVINLNPFMRFDGYYLLAELLGIENLQARAFEVGCWKLRELLFGIGAPCPEDMPRNRIRLLAIYAWAVWLYRVGLFIGIAILVYHYFFKALGILLFAVEIIYFVARPIAAEIAIWWSMKQEILATRRSRLTLAATIAATIACLVPLSSKVEIPAVLETAELQMIHPQRNARVVGVHVKHGDVVRAGEPIATLASREINHEMTRTRIALRIAELQFGRRAVDAVDRESSLILESTIAALNGKISGLEREQRELTITAPFDGKIVDLNPELQVDRWISPRDQIAVVAGGPRMVVKGYAAEADVGRLSTGAAARFIPEHASRSRVALRVERIATAGAPQIEIVDLASTNSGRIPVNLDEKRRLVPTVAQYQVILTAIEPVGETDLSVRGVVLADGRAESLFSRAWRRALGILVRESGA